MARIIIDGQRVTVRHMRPRPSGWYFVPSKAMAAAGFASEPLGKDPVRAAARAQELNEAWDKERTAPGRAMATHGTLAWLYEEYKTSSWFSELTVSTQGDVERCARNMISSPIGHMDVSKIGRAHVRKLYNTILSAKSLSVANKHAKWLRRILNYGVEIEALPTNPATGLGLKQDKPRLVLWDESWVNRFIDKAIEMNKPGWAIAVAIGYDTSQRTMTVCRAMHSHFDGEGIDFPATKGGDAVWCPISPRTISLIKSHPKKSVTLVYGDRGKPITQGAYFSKVFREIRDAAGIPGHVQFKDLRKTAATEVLSGGGRAEPITGHKPNSSMMKHYQVANKAAARSSQEARERGRENAKPRKERK